MGKYVIEQKMNEIQARYNSKRLTIKMPIYSPKSRDLTNQNRERERWNNWVNQLIKGSLTLLSFAALMGVHLKPNSVYLRLLAELCSMVENAIWRWCLRCWRASRMSSIWTPPINAIGSFKLWETTALLEVLLLRVRHIASEESALEQAGRLLENHPGPEPVVS